MEACDMIWALDRVREKMWFSSGELRTITAKRREALQWARKQFEDWLHEERKDAAAPAAAPFPQQQCDEMAAEYGFPGPCEATNLTVGDPEVFKLYNVRTGQKRVVEISGPRAAVDRLIRLSRTKLRQDAHGPAGLTTVSMELVESILSQIERGLGEALDLDEAQRRAEGVS